MFTSPMPTLSPSQDDPPQDRPSTPPRTTASVIPPTPTTSRRTQEAWLRNVNDTLNNYVEHLGELNAELFALTRRPITRLLLGAALATAPSIGDLAEIIAANPDWMAEDTDDDSMDEDTTDPPTHPKAKAAELKNEKRFGAIEDALARLEGLLLKTLTPVAPPPAKGGQTSGQKKPKPTPPKDSPPGKPASPRSPPRRRLPLKSSRQLPTPPPLQKGPAPAKVLFAPASPFARDDNNGTINGQNGLNLINGSLKDLTPTCSIKGLRWTSRGNIMLTPELPEQWDILAKHGPAVLEKHMGKTFSVLTHGPTKDVVLHGWGATHNALPNVGNVCAKITTVLGLDPYDIVVNKSRWLVGKNTNPNRPPLLLLAISTDEAAEKLLYQNPHWIEGKKVAFKVFSSDPTIPNQCARCWKVGHPTWHCGVKPPVLGDRCPHFTLQCPNCQDAHEAWDRKCVERQIQKAVNLPEKRAQSLGPHRDISKYKDLELVKKFQLWALFNELPLIVTSPSGDVSWSPPPPAPLPKPYSSHPLALSTMVLRLGNINIHQHNQELTVILDRALDTHHVLVVTELPWIRIGAGRKGAPKHRDWVLALPLSPTPADSTPRVGIYVNRKLLPNHGLTVNPNTFASPNAVHATISAHGKQINVFGFYRPPSERSVSDESHMLQKIRAWDVPLADSIIMGDLNLHHSSWDVTAADDIKGEAFKDWANDEGLFLKNDPLIHTYHPADPTKKPSVIDLTLTNGSLQLNWTTNWEVDVVIGHPSDHLGTDEFLRVSAIFGSNLEIALASAEGPTSNCSNPLPFWDVELTLLRNDKEQLAREYRQLTRSHPDKAKLMEELHIARGRFKGHFNAAQRKYLDHLITTTPADQVHRLSGWGLVVDGTTISSPEGKAEVFRKAFFPEVRAPVNIPIIPELARPTWPFTPITRQEVKSAVFGPSQNKAPGKSGIGYRVLWEAESIESGSLPGDWLIALVAATQKPGKDDYSSP
ncbi:hypothetical protein BOTBODRAFT_176876 [Botryobasidium botryosum FD-172 SS1]|uniref:Endonuclease/exonuclease/phosphatase domain-containing protein n=1 Tax=Botryobasidium botryosum (strain FD-172 SS1) TaxID=930990 RepID=A0A067MJZ9_BOTB1|nr:hypothetical protein BOTBODRAFT_176876 [Botryobasidium botryosum FD-172 SS1]